MADKKTELTNDELESVVGGWTEGVVYEIGDFVEPDAVSHAYRRVYEILSVGSEDYASGIEHKVRVMPGNKYTDYTAMPNDQIPTGLRKVPKPSWIPN